MTKARSEERRKFAVELVLRRGKSAEEAAQVLGCSRQAVSEWIRRYREGGKEALRTRGGRGRKFMFTEEDVRELVRAANEAGNVASFLAMHRLVVSRGVQASEPGVRRNLKRLGYAVDVAQNGRARWTRRRGGD